MSHEGMLGMYRLWRLQDEIVGRLVDFMKKPKEAGGKKDLAAAKEKELNKKRKKRGLT